jgi:hypothetical protein
LPVYMDGHNVEGGVSANNVADARRKDLRKQARRGVDYKSNWVSEAEGEIFCPVEAPSAEAANLDHREAHELVADAIDEVEEGT